MRISDWSSDVCSFDLADHSALSPQAIFRRLKVNPGHFNFQRQTLAGLLSGKDQPLKDRLDWGQMRMDPADISDVTGSTYTYLVNGHGPMDNWTRSEEHTSELQSLMHISSAFFCLKKTK